MMLGQFPIKVSTSLLRPSLRSKVTPNPNKRKRKNSCHCGHFPNHLLKNGHITMHSGQFYDEMLKTEDIFEPEPFCFDMEDLLANPFDNMDLKLEEEHFFKQNKTGLFLNQDCNKELFISEERLPELNSHHNHLSEFGNLSFLDGLVHHLKETELEQKLFVSPKVEQDFDIKDFEQFSIQRDFLQTTKDLTDDLHQLKSPDIFNLDTIKSDCMWSSTFTTDINTITKQENHRHRRRDLSLTLSECIEGVITSIAMTDIQDTTTHMDMSGTTPPTQIGGNILETGIWTVLNDASKSVSTSETDSEDEEIDVVTSNDDEDPFLLSRQKIPSIKAGSSLLLSRNKLPYRQTPVEQSFIDHSYSMAPSTSPKRIVLNNFKGMLTPTESSEDEGETVHTTTSPCTNLFGKTVVSNSLGNPGSNSFDKRKIAQALQSLIDNKQRPRSSSVVTSTPAAAVDTVKFKFRMKFKSTSPQRRTLVPAITPTKTPKHKPVVKEPKYSPTPAKNVTPVKCVGSGSPARFKRGSSSCSTSSNSGSTEKCREIRDLHNSMERQRRVDLRLNFEQLKSVVPELLDVEKASKLVILNKSSNYCKLLSNFDTRLTTELKQESAKNAQLRKKLREAQKKLKNLIRH